MIHQFLQYWFNQLQLKNFIHIVNISKKTQRYYIVIKKDAVYQEDNKAKQPIESVHIC